MKLKKPYSKYVGRIIIYDGHHHHFIVKSLGKKAEDQFVHFDTLCISYNGNDIVLEKDDNAGFSEDALDQELGHLYDKEKHWLIKFALTGKEKLPASNL